MASKTLAIGDNELYSVGWIGDTPVTTAPFNPSNVIRPACDDSPGVEPSYTTATLSDGIMKILVNLCRPRISVSLDPSRWDPAWAGCTVDNVYFTDPPFALTAMTSMSPAQATGDGAMHQEVSQSSAQADPRSSEISRVLPPLTIPTTISSLTALTQGMLGPAVITPALQDPQITLSVSSIAPVSTPSRSPIGNVGQNPPTPKSNPQVSNSQSAKGEPPQKTPDSNAPQDPNIAISNVPSSISTSFPPKSDAAIQSMADSLLKPGPDNKDPAATASVTSVKSVADASLKASNAANNLPWTSTVGINDPGSKGGSSHSDPSDPNQSFTDPSPPLAITLLSNGIVSLELHSLDTLPRS